MVRHYESLGLLPTVARTESGYRRYSDKEVHTLRFIRRARDLGFSMAEIAELLKLWQNRRRASADVKRIGQRHVANLERRMTAMAEMRDSLKHLTDGCRRGQICHLDVGPVSRRPFYIGLPGHVCGAEKSLSGRSSLAAVKSANGVVDSNAFDLVVGAVSSRPGCCCGDHGVLRPQSSWRRGCRADATGCTGQARASRRRRRRRARASPSRGPGGKRLIRLGSVRQSQRCQQAQVQRLRFLLLYRRDPEFGAGCAGTRFHPHGVFHRGAQGRHVRR